VGGGAGGRYADLRLRHVATCCGIRVRRNSKARRGRSALAPQMQSLVMVAFVGAIVACVAYARAIALQLRAQHAPYVAEGAAVICALAAAFVAFAAVDSHLFLALKAPRKLSCKQTAMQLFIPFAGFGALRTWCRISSRVLSGSGARESLDDSMPQDVCPGCRSCEAVSALAQL
jgi:hypothetical protein